MLDEPRLRSKALTSVSIVIPVRNGERYIEEALESVLRQGPLVSEVLVVNDRSTDGTAAKVAAMRDPRIRLLDHSSGRQGVSAVRNDGLLQATGEWTMFLDADDRLRDGAIAALHKGAGDAGTVAVYGDYERISETGAKIGRRNLIRARRKSDGHVLETLLGRNFIVNGGIMLVRTEAFRSIGGFDETLRYAEDWHGWCRLAALGTFVYLPGCYVLDYRVHTASVMMKKLLTYADCSPAIDAVFTDPAIVAAVAADRLAELRRKAEAHMNAYVVAQAFRAHRYRDAFLSLADTMLNRPRQSPRAMLLSAAALAGI
ncbi:glycosyltransferase family 2 protein [Shinella oryzae]|uniref:glycosyltransferase family 2 protein n=1 Tax=Shinella oryzae TaxID=2871820 RepID=UPI0031BB904C|nr:glycosyltransferase [Shinella oryzae]